MGSERRSARSRNPVIVRVMAHGRRLRARLRYLPLALAVALLTAAAAVSAGGKSVYAAGYRDNAIVRVDRDPTTGALTPKGCIADPAHNPDHCAKTAKGLDGPFSVTVSADGKSVYAAGNKDNAIV